MNEKVDNLKPEVREAVAAVSRWMGDDKDWATIRAELVRLARDNEALRGKCNVIMSGSTQHLGRAERAESELAALKRRIAEAPDATLTYRGKRCRLLLDDGEGA